ncbi:MAG: ATP-binding protein [Candidatus Anammoxibacter sp.]
MVKPDFYLNLLFIMIYQRKIQGNIAEYINTSDVIVIHGARQVGKTTIMTSLMEELAQKQAPPNNIIYFDLEDFELLALCNDGPDAVVNHLKGIGCNLKELIYLFIDEVQYLENPSSFLKLFHDRYKGKVKLTVSGSSSFAIKSKFKESLVGRTVDFEVFGLDFEEMLVFKEKKFDLNVKHSGKIKNELKRLYAEYILYGGYPRIVLEDSIKKKEFFLKQIINTYIKRDIRDFLNIKDTGKFNAFLRTIASQSSMLCNTNELSNTLRMSRKTVDEYLFILENTYIVRRLYPFHKNIRSEISKMPKIFLEDTGIMNLLINGTFSTTISGELFETSVFSYLRKNINLENLHYWRTNRGQEIDFIVSRNRSITPVETKMRFTSSSMSSIRYFHCKYPDSKGVCVTLEFDTESVSKSINIVYPWELLNCIDTN